MIVEKWPAGKRDKLGETLDKLTNTHARLGEILFSSLEEYLDFN